MKREIEMDKITRSLRLMVFVFFCLMSALFHPDFAHANGLTISNVKVTERDTTANTIKVQFDITWNNAWKDETNNDAVWVFVKYYKDLDIIWQHASITFSGTSPTGSTIIPQTDKRGVFIQPKNYGSGTQTYTGVQLTWNYGEDGLTDAEVVQTTYFAVKVFGIEMVYIPRGGFYAGDGYNTYYEFKQGSSDTTPWFIPNENAIHVTNCSSGGYYYTSASLSGEDASGSEFWISKEFPKGFNAFYIMKYEISEGQWVDFFNVLDQYYLTQKWGRDITDATGKNSDSTVDRNTVSWPGGTATTSRSHRACGYLSWPDVMAYADWAGLRPMTELEFEKACRGPLAPVAAEYVWGDSSSGLCSSISGTEDGTETCSTAGGNLNINTTVFTGGDGGSGPLRGGIFATSSSTRWYAGATYYGVLDMAGNVWERVVTVGNAAGRAFRGTHGDGNLESSNSGYAGNADWPGYDASTREVSGAAGSGFRGAGFVTPAAGSYNANISSRGQAANDTGTARTKAVGGRLVRTSS